MIPIKVDSGITLERQLEMVPDFEAREAAVYTLCPFKMWETLPASDRAFAVAHYRMHLAIQGHMQQAAEQAAESAAARSRRNA